MKDYFKDEDVVGETETPSYDNDPNRNNHLSLQSTVGVNDWRKPAGPQFTTVK